MPGVERHVTKDELVEQLARRLARLTKDELQSLAEAVEGGGLDFEALARDARRAAGAETGPPFAFQRRLANAWRREGDGGS